MRNIFLLSFSFLTIVFAAQTNHQTSAGASITLEPGETLGIANLVEEAQLKSACAKAISLVQHSQVAWYKKQTCTSCHHQLLPEIPIKLARERGIAIDEKVAQETTSNAFAFLKDLDGLVQGYDYIDVFFDGWALTAAHVAGVRPNLATIVEAQFIASRQLSDGSWPTIDDRPPQSYSRFATTAVCARAVGLYLPDQFKKDREASVQRARRWLLRAQPESTEDRVFQLFGLSWTGVDERTRKNAARQLLAEQREDGGWSQLPGMASDAYSTGDVLVALHETAALPTSDPAYQRGLRFLLKTQEPDGSWRVRSRLHPPAPVSPPYVDVEFPYQHDQFVSIMATSWAAAAILNALPQLPEKQRLSTVPDFAPSEQPEWMRIALTGSVADLKRLLDGGIKPNVKTAEGTTPLMLAARDLAKVKLLVERGADVNARTPAGVTPLMVAARYRGNADVVRLLLKKGAKPNADKGVEVRNDASAVFFAVMAGDKQSIEALLNAGARLDRMKILGQFYSTPLNYATFIEEVGLIDYLITKGADPSEVDDDGISALAWAAIGNRVNTFQTLLSRGAKVNSIDKHGMTPLLYAASIDYGDTSIIEKLIAAGADLKAKNKDGLTALDLAKNYNHSAIVSLLAQKTAAR